MIEAFFGMLILYVIMTSLIWLIYSGTSRIRQRLSQDINMTVYIHKTSTIVTDNILISSFAFKTFLKRNIPSSEEHLEHGRVL